MADGLDCDADKAVGCLGRLAAKSPNDDAAIDVGVASVDELKPGLDDGEGIGLAENPSIEIMRQQLPKVDVRTAVVDDASHECVEPAELNALHEGLGLVDENAR